MFIDSAIDCFVFIDSAIDCFMSVEVMANALRPRVARGQT
jgi:hypothetical protein